MANNQPRVTIDPTTNTAIGYDSDTGDVVVIHGSVEMARLTKAGVLTPASALAGSVTADVEGDIAGATLTGQAQGDIIRHGATGWEAHSANTIGNVLVGDGTDVKSVAMSGDCAIDAAGAVTIQPSAVEDSMLASKLVKDIGGQAIGYLDATGAGSDTETVTIGTRVYELDTDAVATITAGRVRVNVSGGANATQVATALVAAINGDASRVADAVDVGDGTVLLVQKAVGASNPALSEATANVAVSAAALVGAEIADVKRSRFARRTITAADVTVSTDTNGTIAIVGIPATGAPGIWTVQVRSSAGVVKACSNVQWSWVRANSNYYLLKAVEVQNGATDFANGDTIDVLVGNVVDAA